jgi:hypothetical protein
MARVKFPSKVDCPAIIPKCENIMHLLPLKQWDFVVTLVCVPNTERQSSHPVGIPFHAFLAIYVMLQDKIFEVDKWICFELFL